VLRPPRHLDAVEKCPSTIIRLNSSKLSFHLERKSFGGNLPKPTLQAQVLIPLFETQLSRLRDKLEDDVIQKQTADYLINVKALCGPFLTSPLGANI
jgi:hypothetical protein